MLSALIYAGSEKWCYDTLMNWNMLILKNYIMMIVEVYDVKSILNISEVYISYVLKWYK